MNSFEVDTLALKDAAECYSAISKVLSYELGELRESRRQLSDQSGCEGALEALSAAIARMEQCISQITELSRQGRWVSAAYEKAEKKAGNIVEALPGAPPFPEPGGMVRTVGARFFTPVRVQTSYPIGTACLLGGNKLPYEDWLLARIAGHIA